jgi:hypothetical protein
MWTAPEFGGAEHAQLHDARVAISCNASFTELRVIYGSTFSLRAALEASSTRQITLLTAVSQFHLLPGGCSSY